MTCEPVPSQSRFSRHTRPSRLSQATAVVVETPRIIRVRVGSSRSQDKKTRGSFGAAGLVAVCIFPADSMQAMTFFTSHENLLGNCFANAVVRVSAMT